MAHDRNNGGTAHRVLGAAKMVVGAAFIYEGYKSLFRGVPQPALLGRLDPQTAPGKILKTSVIVPTRNIDDRVRHIQEKGSIGSISPRVKELVAAVLNRKCGDKWCVPEKDYAAEIKTLFHAVKDVNGAGSVRYVRDHAYVDQFVSAAKTLDLKIGDCDDMTILLAAMLLCAGYPVNARVVKAAEADSWSHIYLKTGLPPQKPTRWMALDLTVKHPPGWEVPGAEEALLTGEPSGYIDRTKDFPVWDPHFVKVTRR
jgi:hypothetical protein